MVVVDGVEMVDVAEAARLVERTPETVRRWIWSGRLPARKAGNRLLIPRAALQTAGGRQPPDSRPLVLAQWRRLVDERRADGLLGQGEPGQSAAELVLADRGARDAD